MELGPIGPELWVASLALLLVPLAGWCRGKWAIVPSVVASLGWLGALVLTLRMLGSAPTEVFCGTYAVDGFGTVFKLLLETGALLATWMAASGLRRLPALPHLPAAIAFAALGGIGLTSSLDLGLIILFVQMLSLASYLLSGLVRTDSPAQEGMLKIFLLGATSLAISIYGLSWLFGLTGSLSLQAIGHGLLGADRVWVALALGLTVVGYAFEVTAVPFQFWAPDAYQGARASLAGTLSVVPKIAGFAGLMRLLLTAFPGGLAGWPTMIAVLAALTMTLGNLIALKQTSLKRLLAYSSIAQAGYVLMAVAVADRVASAVLSITYYLVVYLFMNLGAFVAVSAFERATGKDSRQALRGLSERSPAIALILAVSLLSLAGIPPFGGFVGKVFLIQAAISGGLSWLAAFAALNMAIALAYYLGVIADMYLEPPEQPEALERMPFESGLGLGLVAAQVWLGILPATWLVLIAPVSRLFR